MQKLEFSLSLSSAWVLIGNNPVGNNPPINEVKTLGKRDQGDAGSTLINRKGFGWGLESTVKSETWKQTGTATCGHLAFIQTKPPSFSISILQFQGKRQPPKSSHILGGVTAQCQTKATFILIIKKIYKCLWFRDMGGELIERIKGMVYPSLSTKIK